MNQIHPKIGASAFAGSLAAMLITFCKVKLLIDFSGQEANMVVVIMALVGWLVPGADDAAPAPAAAPDKPAG